MTLQARLTLYYALLAVLMAGVISGVNLINETQAQFDLTLERAQMLQRLAVEQLIQVKPKFPFRTPLTNLRMFDEREMLVKRYNGAK
jgi:hypothetical protein